MKAGDEEHKDDDENRRAKVYDVADLIVFQMMFSLLKLCVENLDCLFSVYQPRSNS